MFIHDYYFSSIFAKNQLTIYNIAVNGKIVDNKQRTTAFVELKLTNALSSNRDQVNRPIFSNSLTYRILEPQNNNEFLTYLECNLDHILPISPEWLANLMPS